jgi:hypothetical protein
MQITEKPHRANRTLKALSISLLRGCVQAISPAGRGVPCPCDNPDFANDPHSEEGSFSVSSKCSFRIRTIYFQTFMYATASGCYDLEDRSVVAYP